MVYSGWFYRVLVWFTVDGFTGFWYGLQFMVLQGFGMVYSRWFYRVLAWFIVDGFTGFWYGSQ